jgi:manganese/zinc/iron transport system permease protein
MIEYNTLVVLLGVGLLGSAAGLVGCLAVLRRRALVGDALAHAALPGLCLAFLALGERNLAVMLAGALLSGLLGVAVIAGLRRWTRAREDVALGIVLSVFFGAGIVLSRLIQNRSTEGSKAGLDAYILGKTAGIILADVYLIGGLALACVLFVVLLFKELKLVCFDPDFARGQGWPVGRLDLLLMGFVAVAVVIGLPTVGVVMIAALLILPGVAARFWAERLGVVLALSAALGLGTGAIGTAVSANYSEMPAGPVIALVGSGFFLVSALLAPRRGLLARWVAHVRFRRAADRAALLRILFDLSEPHLKLPEVVGPGRRTGPENEVPSGGRDLPPLPKLPEVAPEAILRRKAWHPLRLRWLLRDAARRGAIVTEPGGAVRLTPVGLERAAEVARRRRLWQLFLTEYPDLVGLARPLEDDPVESALPGPMVAELEAKLRAAGRWPNVPKEAAS